MAKKFEASQSVWFVARVMGAKKEEKETKSGKKYVEYNLTTRLPEGNTIFIKKRRWEISAGKEEPEFVKESFDKLNKIIEDVSSSKTVFISKFISKPKEKSQFDWITSYENSEGKVTYSVEGFVNLQEFEESGDDFLIKFKEGSSNFKDLKSKIETSMYAVDVEGSKIVLSDAKESFPNELIVYLPEGIENKVEIGKAYNIKANFIKGKKVKSEGVFDFNGGSKAEYEPDKLEVFYLSKIDGAVLDNAVSTDDFPF